MSNLYQIAGKMSLAQKPGSPHQSKSTAEVKNSQDRSEPSDARLQFAEQEKNLQVEPPFPISHPCTTRPSNSMHELAECNKYRQDALKTKVKRKFLPNRSPTSRETEDLRTSVSETETSGRQGAPWVESQEPSNDEIVLVPQEDTESIDMERETGSSIRQGGENIVIEGVLPEDLDQVREELFSDAVSATDIRPYYKGSLAGKGRWIFILVIVIAVLILAALGTSLGVVLSKDNKESTELQRDNSTNPPTLPPTTERFSVVAAKVEALFGFSLKDATSPQWMATQWLSENDNLLDSYLSDSERFQQRYALVTFYFSTGGPAWIDNSYFLLPSMHECNWTVTADALPELNVPAYRGVHCSGLKVDSIVFSNNNLTGSIPPQVQGLSELSELILQSNDLFDGSLPTELFTISALQSILLPFNNISGSIPTEIGLTNGLEELWLQGNSLTGSIPSEVGRNTDLFYLTLYENQLNSSLPESLTQLSKLETFDINENKIGGALPSSISTAWPKLFFLGLYVNRLTGTIPNDIGMCTALQFISFRQNDFEGPFPASILQAPLQVLDLSENHLTGRLPENWSRQTDLSILAVRQNNLTSTLPEQLGDLAALTIADFSQNSFSGTIPPEFGNNSHIEIVNFAKNHFVGTVPRTFLRWKNLAALAMHKNLLSGDLSFLCDTNDPTKPASPQITVLYADCLEEVVCPCCNYCCDANDECVDI